MDQYIVEFNAGMLFYDLLALIELIEQSGNEDLIQYIPNWKEQLEAEAGEKIFED